MAPHDQTCLRDGQTGGGPWFLLKSPSYPACRQNRVHTIQRLIVSRSDRLGEKPASRIPRSVYKLPQVIGGAERERAGQGAAGT